MEITAAIIKEKGGKFLLEKMELDSPKPNEVLIKIVATGMCHTDMAVRDQLLPSPLPMVLGHEGAGIVEAVGAEITKVEVGDHVVLTFGFCGKCPNCLKGLPSYCYSFGQLNFSGSGLNGSHNHHNQEGGLNDHFFSQSSFGTHALALENNVIKVDKNAPLEILGPLGCGIQTGAGSVINSFKAGEGSSIVVFGTGAVGLSAIMAAVVVKCATIIAVDINNDRLNFAKELGATHLINSKDTDVVNEIRGIAEDGVDFAFETTGRSDVIKNAMLSLVSNGICGIVGASAKPLDLDANYIVAKGLHIKGIVEGDSIPDIFIPKLVELYQEGKFPFDKLVKVYPFEKINEAAEDSERGITIKPVIRIGKL
jgi:aryl-alcohol dehydrogenase